VFDIGSSLLRRGLEWLGGLFVRSSSMGRLDDEQLMRREQQQPESTMSWKYICNMSSCQEASPRVVELTSTACRSASRRDCLLDKGHPRQNISILVVPIQTKRLITKESRLLLALANNFQNVPEHNETS
jgi:hypothetical protein